jgi:hypothetical protein
LQAFLKGTIDLSRREGLFALFDLRCDFPNEWARLTQAAAPPPLALPGLAARLPYFTRAAGSKPIPATEVYLFWRSAGTPKAPTFQHGSDDPLPFGPASIVDQDPQTKTFSLGDGLSLAIDEQWTIAFDKPPAAQDSLWLVVKYVMPN